MGPISAPPPEVRQRPSPSPKRKTRQVSSNNNSYQPYNYQRAPSSESRSSGNYDSALFASFYYSTADEGNYKGQTTYLGQTLDYTATEDTDSAPGLAAGYAYRPSRGFGFTGFAAYEFPRKSKGFHGTAGNYKITGTYSGDVSTSILTGVANAIWSYESWLYFYGGANYPMIMGGNDSIKLSGQPGYQLGIGSRITQQIGAHLEYRVIRMKGQVNIPGLPLTIDEATLPGWIFSLDYSI